MSIGWLRTYSYNPIPSTYPAGSRSSHLPSVGECVRYRPVCSPLSTLNM